MTYTKIKFDIILIYVFFPRMNNEKIKKRSPQNFLKMGRGQASMYLAKMSRMAPCDTRILCGQSPVFEEGEDPVPE